MEFKELGYCATLGERSKSGELLAPGRCAIFLADTREKVKVMIHLYLERDHNFHKADISVDPDNASDLILFLKQNGLDVSLDKFHSWGGSGIFDLFADRCQGANTLISEMKEVLEGRSSLPTLPINSLDYLGLHPFGNEARRFWGRAYTPFTNQPVTLCKEMKLCFGEVTH